MIDPKRLTEADKGREVVFKELWVGELQQGKICYWDQYSDWITIDFGRGSRIQAHKMCLFFLDGTYQDGGSE